MVVKRRHGGRVAPGSGLVNRYRSVVTAQHRARHAHEVACDEFDHPLHRERCIAPDLWAANIGAVAERTDAYDALRSAGIRPPWMPYPWQRPDPITDDTIAIFAALADAAVDDE